MGRRFIKILLFVLFSSSVYTSCTSSDSCLHDLSNVGLNVMLYKMVYDDETETFGAQVYQGAITLSGIGVDSLLCDSSVVSKFILPLKMHDTVSVFSLSIYHKENDSIQTCYHDTLTVFHSNEQKLVSLECGCAYDYLIKDFGLTVHGLDSAVIENPEVTYKANVNNVKLYLKNR